MKNNTPIIDSDDGMAPPEHIPELGERTCVCGGEEQYFEDWGVTGYGCEVTGPYRATLDRLGWHISREARWTIYRNLTDEQENSLTDDESDRLQAWEERETRF
jgi:hypothetical protein